MGVPIIRILAYWGLYWGPLIFGNYHFLMASGPHGSGVTMKSGEVDDSVAVC